MEDHTDPLYSSVSQYSVFLDVTPCWTMHKSCAFLKNFGKFFFHAARRLVPEDDNAYSHLESPLQ